MPTEQTAFYEIYFEHGGAVISTCSRYRYVLWRKGLVHGDTRKVNFVMLNPSTADARTDDPTVRRCVSFAKTWGYGELYITNLFAWRSTDPKALEWPETTDPKGPLNRYHVLETAKASDLVVCAWGANEFGREAGKEVCALFAQEGIKINAIRLTAYGYPRHPLYLSNRERATEWGKPYQRIAL